jgi:hypothetical protein
MAEKVAAVYKFEYEMNESLWTACIAGFSQDEAAYKLNTLVPGKINKINSIAHICRLDAISNQMTNDIVQPFIDQFAKKTAPKPKTTLKTKIETKPKKSPTSKTPTKVSK